MVLEGLRKKRICVTGAGGFIGHHLARRLREMGAWVRGVDIVDSWGGRQACDQFLTFDLREPSLALLALSDVDWVFALAADMGGIGYISEAHAEIVAHNTAITYNTISASRKNGAERLLFASSACIYHVSLQEDADEVVHLKEGDAYPALPEGAYGWEKLHGEHLCRYYGQTGWLQTRVARIHNCYGPEGTWQGGREKAPAALCRKVALAKLNGDREVVVWGDGLQRRSFMYIDDCVEGLIRLMFSDHAEPVNLGRDRAVSINELLGIIARAADYEVEVEHNLSGWQGVRNRCSDNRRCRALLGWEPQISLEEGIPPTYAWIEKEAWMKTTGMR